MPRQFLDGRYLDLPKLQQLLTQLFPRKWSAEEKSDGVVITVPRELTDAEIKDVQISD